MRDLSIYWLWEPRHWSPWEDEYFAAELELAADASPWTPAGRRLATALAEAARAGVPADRILIGLCSMAREVVEADTSLDWEGRRRASEVIDLSELLIALGSDANLRVQLERATENLGPQPGAQAAASAADAVIRAVLQQLRPVVVFALALLILGQLGRAVGAEGLEGHVLLCAEVAYHRIFVRR